MIYFLEFDPSVRGTNPMAQIRASWKAENSRWSFSIAGRNYEVTAGAAGDILLEIRGLRRAAFPIARKQILPRATLRWLRFLSPCATRSLSTESDLARRKQNSRAAIRRDGLFSMNDGNIADTVSFASFFFFRSVSLFPFPLVFFQKKKKEKKKNVRQSTGPPGDHPIAKRFSPNVFTKSPLQCLLGTTWSFVICLAFVSRAAVLHFSNGANSADRVLLPRGWQNPSYCHIRVLTFVGRNSLLWTGRIFSYVPGLPVNVNHCCDIIVVFFFFWRR